MTVQALKPIISGFLTEHAAISDSGRLLHACNQPITADTLEAISPWRFEAALSPHDAATLAGTSIDLPSLIEWTQDAIQRPHDVHLIEGAGGVMTPINPSYTMRDWMAALNIPVILVTTNYLGTISHTLTAWEALQQRAIPVSAILINQYPQPQPDTPSLTDLIATLRSFTHDQTPIRTLAFQHDMHFTSQQHPDDASWWRTEPDLTDLLT